MRLANARFLPTTKPQTHEQIRTLLRRNNARRNLHRRYRCLPLHPPLAHPLPNPLNHKTMNKFEVINWSQYMRASECFAPCDTLQEAMADCKHQTPHGADAQSWEEYSEVTEIDPYGNPVETYYFVTL